MSLRSSMAELRETNISPTHREAEGTSHSVTSLTYYHYPGCSWVPKHS